jgi:hypothetical protein
MSGMSALGFTMGISRIPQISFANKCLLLPAQFPLKCSETGSHFFVWKIEPLRTWRVAAARIRTLFGIARISMAFAQLQ